MVYFVINKYSGSYSEKKITGLSGDAGSFFKKYCFRETLKCGSRISIDVDPSKVEKDDIIAAVGGDGTINACLQFIHDNNLQDVVSLGIVPLGTGNNMLRSLRLSKNFVKAMEILKNRHTEKISYGTVNGEKVFFNCSLGFTSYVLRKRKTNSIAGYFYDALRLLPSYKCSSIQFFDTDKTFDLFAGFFINTRIYMSKFKFLKSNNSGDNLNFFHIDKGNMLSIPLKAGFAFIKNKSFKKISERKYVFRLDGQCEIETDGDIYSIKYPASQIIIENHSTVNVITNNKDIK